MTVPRAALVARRRPPGGHHSAADPPDPARTPLQVPLRGTCAPSPERDALRFTITPLGGASRAVTKIVQRIVRYLTPRTLEPTASARDTRLLPPGRSIRDS
jgi:hypothetical protein